MKWRLGMWQHNTTGRAYSLTYPGQPAEGRVRASIKTGGTTIETALVPGPCSGYEIAGRVFVDPDSSGTRDPGEDSGIADVVVEMHDGAGRVFTTVTGSDGGYRFLTSLGTFTIEIDTTDHLDHFNDDLQDGFAPTTPLTRVVTVGPDGLQDVDFGVVPVYLDLIEDIVEEELVSPGLDIVFWRDQLFAASRHSPPDTIEVVYDRPTLLGFLSEIEGLWLEDPFRFADGRETQDALLMLSGAPTEPLDLLRMELLAAELNFVAGLTLVGEADLHAVLCAWGEGLVVDTESEGDVPAGIVKPPLFDGEIATKAGGISRVILRRPIYEIEQATILFHLMNTGGGGGVDEK